MQESPPIPPKPSLQKLLERAAASRFFTVSVLLHLVIVILGGSVILFKRGETVEDFAATSGLVAPAEEMHGPPDEPPVLQDVFVAPAPTVSAPALAIIATTAPAPTFQVAAVPPIIKPMPNMPVGTQVGSLGTAPTGMSGNVPSAMGGRMSGNGRAALMQLNGGKKESETAVLRGLRWLVKHQSSDGSWAPEYQPAFTGFALLCFLGHGETTNSVEFGPTVKKGIDWLISNGNKHDGRMCMTDSFASHDHNVYQHGIATYALGEYYAMTKDDRAKVLFQKAIGYIVSEQGNDGGWCYKYEKAGKGDTSVTGWHIQALKVAKLSGLGIPGVDAALDKSLNHFKRVQGPQGGFGYRDPDNQYAMTGVGVLSLYFIKERDKAVRDGVEWIMKKCDEDYPINYKDAKMDLYGWYYHTQALMLYGGAAWNKWNRQFQDQLINNQNEDGSWPPVAGNAPAAAFQKIPDGAGPYYRTVLCILMLEVYYRYSSAMR